MLQAAKKEEEKREVEKKEKREKEGEGEDNFCVSCRFALYKQNRNASSCVRSVFLPFKKKNLVLRVCVARSSISAFQNGTIRFI